MQATIKYRLTEATQRAKMVATGQPVTREQEINVEVSSENLDLFSITDNGLLRTLDLSQTYDSKEIAALKAAGVLDTYRESSALAPDFIDGLRRGAVILAERKAEEKRLIHANGEHNRRLTEQAYQRFLADPTVRISEYSSNHYGVEGLLSNADYWPNNHEEFKAEIRRRNEADIAAKKVADEARERAKEEFIATWVTSHGDDELKQQFADGLACRKTLIAMIAKIAFDAALVPPVYEPHTCDDRNCQCGIQDIDCLPRKAYSAWRQIKTNLPEGTVAEFERVIECNDDEDPEIAPPTKTYSALIKMPYGPFTFERRVMLG